MEYRVPFRGTVISDATERLYSCICAVSCEFLHEFLREILPSIG